MKMQGFNKGGTTSMGKGGGPKGGKGCRAGGPKGAKGFKGGKAGGPEGGMFGGKSGKTKKGGKPGKGKSLFSKSGGPEENKGKTGAEKGKNKLDIKNILNNIQLGGSKGKPSSSKPSSTPPTPQAKSSPPSSTPSQSSGQPPLQANDSGQKDDGPIEAIAKLLKQLGVPDDVVEKLKTKLEEKSSADNAQTKAA